MSYKPQTLFNGTPGEASVDRGGPVYLRQDLEELAKMFDPNSTHRIDENHPTALPGGISKDNLAFTVTNDYDNTEKSKVTTAYTHANTTNANPHSTDAELVPIDTIEGLTGTEVQTALESLKTLDDAKATTTALTSHTSSTSNPHSVTKAQVGLGNCDNTSDANKPISTATQTALNLKETISDANLLVKTIEFEPTGYEKSGKFKVTTQGGTVTWIDTSLEKVPGSMALVEDPVGSGTYYLVIYDVWGVETSRCAVTTLFNAIETENTTTISLSLTATSTGKKKLTANVIDGSISTTQLTSALQTSISDLISHEIKSITDSSTIDFTFDSTTHDLTADVKDSSITNAKLHSEVTSTISGYATAAATSATNAAASESNASTYAGNASTSAGQASTYAGNASTSATNASNSATASSNSASASATSATASSTSATVAKSWAVGPSGTGTSGTDTNNAKYWCEQAQQAVGADMQKSVYDPTTGGVNTPVAAAGGIPNYVSSAITGKENTSNKVASFQATPDDTHYPSEKLVYDELADKYEKPATGIPSTDLTGGIPYTTTEPDSANTDGIKIVVLASEPSTKYSGWLYLITG